MKNLTNLFFSSLYAAVILLPPLPTFAQSAPTKTDIQKCGRIEVDVSRLACFDALHAHIQGAASESHPVKSGGIWDVLIERSKTDEPTLVTAPPIAGEMHPADIFLVQQMEHRRQENMKRIEALARASGATGPHTATGSPAQAAGPSASYGGRLVARIRPNITVPDGETGNTGNSSAEVEVRSAPDGTILSRKLVKSSGVKAWDNAVLKAIDKTETLPRDVDGRVPSPLVISFRPKD